MDYKYRVYMFKARITPDGIRHQAFDLCSVSGLNNPARLVWTAYSLEEVALRVAAMNIAEETDPAIWEFTAAGYPEQASRWAPGGMRIPFAATA